jgi:hypothetical protein
MNKILLICLILLLLYVIYTSFIISTTKSIPTDKPTSTPISILTSKPILIPTLTPVSIPTSITIDILESKGFVKVDLQTYTKIKTFIKDKEDFRLYFATYDANGDLVQSNVNHVIQYKDEYNEERITEDYNLYEKYTDYYFSFDQYPVGSIISTYINNSTVNGNTVNVKYVWLSINPVPK